MTSKEEHQKKLVSRLRRIEGQIRGIQNMIGDDSSCEEIAQQLAAARKALDRAFYEMLACSMEIEMGGAVSTEDARTAGAHVARILAKYG